MYATTSPKRLKLKTIFIRKGLETLPKIKIKLNKEGDSFVLRKDKGLYSASSLALTPKEHFRLGKMSQYVRVMPNLRTIKNYVSFKEKILKKRTKQVFSSAVFFLSERRFDLKKMISFFKTKVFVYQEGNISFLGTFSGHRSTELQMIQLINDELIKPERRPTIFNI
jgi:hypothetical protein